MRKLSSLVLSLSFVLGLNSCATNQTLEEQEEFEDTMAVLGLLTGVALAVDNKKKNKSTKKYVPTPSYTPPPLTNL